MITKSRGHPHIGVHRAEHLSVARQLSFDDGHGQLTTFDLSRVVSTFYFFIFFCRLHRSSRLSVVDDRTSVKRALQLTRLSTHNDGDLANGLTIFKCSDQLYTFTIMGQRNFLGLL